MKKGSNPLPEGITRPSPPASPPIPCASDRPLKRGMGVTKFTKTSRETGLTDSEQRVMDALVLAFNEFANMERQHPDEMRDFTDGVHRLQDMLAVRIARREFPKGWPTYSE